MVFSRSLLVFGALCTAVNSSPVEPRSWRVGQSVVTSSGTVTGHRAPNAAIVSEYLGIPFGQSTAGNNRFAAPKAYTGTATISGAEFVSFHHRSNNTKANLK